MTQTLEKRDAGQELDADVIEALGGRGRMTVYAWADRGKKEYPVTIFSRPPLSDTYKNSTCDQSFRTFATADGKKWSHDVYIAKRVSEDIAAAFEVVEAMRAKGWDMELLASSNASVCVMFSNRTGDYVGAADSASLAICLASLKALASSPSSEDRNSNG